MFDVKQTEADLIASIEYLENHGWLQHRLWDRSGECCAFGAILLATGDSALMLSEQERSANVCRAWYRVTGIEISGYNDTPGRTKAEVLTKMREVLDVLRTDPDRAMGKEPNRG
jgi:hypothetical protein